VSLLDSQGYERKQLVKSGADDMRQDDVIRQFFVMLNALLQRDRLAVERGLGIRSYKVRRANVLACARRSRKPLKCRCNNSVPCCSAPLPSGRAFLSVCWLT